MPNINGAINIAKKYLVTFCERLEEPPVVDLGRPGGLGLMNLGLLPSILKMLSIRIESGLQEYRIC